MVCDSGTGLIVKVGMAQFRIGVAPMRMYTMALGSCVGIVIHDRVEQMGSLAHVMHPSRDKVKNNSNPAKFVDSAIEHMVTRMVRCGANRKRFTAKLFGGAQMFKHITGSNGLIQVGLKNIEAARETLKSYDIPVIAESVGGTTGKTILFRIDNGSVYVCDAFDNEEIL
ncbi:MAG: chemotaxis protein CheD [Candidatus Krumholzibacteriota bacterium]|nr:chemotaxis protein CheD [Candidatus Krumholzibacteriota bacterium]